MSGLEARQRSNPGPVSPLHDLRTRYIELRARYGDLLWSEPDGAELGVALAGQSVTADDRTVYASPKSIALYWDVQQAVDVRDRHLLVVGERGTGKESIAHLVAARAKSSRVVPVNCATLPESIADALLFGVEANSGIASVGKTGVEGLVSEANGGVLFLDEFFDAAPNVFPKLLRLLQQREWNRVGNPKPNRLDDATFIVAATNRVSVKGALYSLNDELEERIRPDIVDRFDLAIETTPLRERREEIPALANNLINRAWKEKASQRPPSSLDEIMVADEGAIALRDAGHDWPGNIRELGRVLREQLRFQWAQVIQSGVLRIPPSVIEALGAGKRRGEARVRDHEPRSTGSLPAWNDPAWQCQQRANQLIAALRVEMLKEGLSRVDATWVSRQFVALVGGKNAHQALKARAGLKASEVAERVSRP